MFTSSYGQGWQVWQSHSPAAFESLRHQKFTLGQMGLGQCEGTGFRVAEMSGRVSCSGAIVNTSSGAGLVGTVGSSAYTASKHGVVGLAKAAALEYAKEGIRVNAVCPGEIRTPMMRRIMDANPMPEVEYDARQPVGRLGAPGEVAEAVVWLCSNAASFVTGHSMAVDGGAMAQ